MGPVDLSRTPGEHPPGARCPVSRIYLDHNASTPPSPAVVRDMRVFLDGLYGNAGATHPDGLDARAVIDAARLRVVRAVGGNDADRVVFTSGGTESNNLAVLGVAEAELARPGGPLRRHVVCGTHEHLSVARAVEALERRGFRVTWIDPLPSGALDPARFEAAVTGDTLLVCAMFANNETGVLQPVAEIARIAHGAGALVFCDGVCGVGKTALDVRALDCDLLSVSGHKLHAPKGVGALWMAESVAIEPVMLGCGQQAGLRSGTENTMGAVGLGAAMEAHGAARPAAEVAERVRPLRDALIAGLEALPCKPQRNGQGPDLANTCSVWFPGRDALDLQQRLGDFGLSVAAQASRPALGAPARPSHVLKSMGLDDRRATESLRFSLGSNTTREDIDAALFVIRSVLEPAPFPSLETPHAVISPDLCRPSAPSSDCSLDRLTSALAQHLAPERRATSGPEVAALLREYAGAEESWRRYAQYRGDTYSRNLIWRSEDFELLLLCWGEGQESPIHDHAGQHCWMAVLEGELQEVHFDEGTDGLREGRVKDFPAGGVAYIHDEIALHLIRPKPGSSGVSLHLYSSPIDACRTFCPETGAPTAVQVGYHSVRGSLCGEADPAQIRQAWTR